MKRKSLLLMLIMALGAPWAAQAQFSGGNGTSSNPYQIANATDWNTLATNVATGTTEFMYRDVYFCLTNDISVSTMVGTMEGIGNATATRKFGGNFDGQGHTLTFNCTTSEDDCAPFRAAGYGTFKNLRIEGTIQTSGQFAAGLVSHIRGNSSSSDNGSGCTFRNCISNITIIGTNSNSSFDGTYGGLVSHTEDGKNYYYGCAFTGTFSGNGKSWGGLIGWTANYGTGRNGYLYDCLFAPTSISGINNPSDSKTLSRNSPATIENCYYTEALGPTQGKNAYKVTLAANPAAGGTVDGGTPTTDYGFVKAYSNGLLFNGVYYANGSVSLNATANSGYTFSQWSDNSTDNPRTVNVSSNASYTATFTQGGGGGGGSDGTLTVYDGTATSQKVPMYVYYFDDFTRSQFVIPAADLTDMAGGTINSIKFYTKSDNIPYTTVADFDIYVKEVNYTTITALEAKSSATIVYQGKGNFVTEGSGGSITITFSNPFIYNGGNLLIGCDNTTDAGWKSIYFYGQEVTGASTGASNGSSLDQVSSSQQNFIPKTTFYYTKCITEIASVTDWNEFCDIVNNGYNYSGKTVTMTADVGSESTPVTTMAGTISGTSADKCFSGTFEGNGHTIYINVTGQARFAAPFRCVNGAIIKNVRSAGTISGFGNSDGKILAGIVGNAQGDTQVIGCSSSATITSNIGPDSCLCGIVGSYNGTLTVDGCVFTGSLTGGATNTKNGGIVGYRYGGNCTVKNSIFNPSSIGVSTSDNTYSATIARTTNTTNQTLTITNCYYFSTLGKVQGKQAYSVTGDTGIEVTMNGTATTYSGSGIIAYKNGDTQLSGLVYNGTIYGGSGESLSLTLSGASRYQADHGTLTVSGNTYSLTMAASNTVISAGPPTTIASVEDWNAFCAAVNSGHSYSGETVTMTDNVGTVSTMCGTSSNTPFSGTFDGGGYTLTVGITGNSTQGQAPFQYISGATIENLIVTGSVTATSGSYPHASGLVGFAWSGTNTIDDCLVHTNVTNNASSVNSHIGGIVGHAKSSTVVLNGCVYDGLLTSSNWKGGLVGWADKATVQLTNCLFNGTVSTTSNFHPIGCCNGGDTPIQSGSFVTNCYYYATNTISSHIDDSDTHSIVAVPTGKGKRAYSITGQSPVIVANAGNATTYGGDNVTHYITGYGTGIKYNNVLYAGSGDNVSLTLSNSNTGKYYASAGTLSGSTLTMPAENVTISDAMVLVNASGNTWNIANHWSPSRVPTADDAVTIYYNVTIPANCVAKANYIKVTDNAVLTIADGGQLFCNSEVTATVQKNIAKHGANAQEGGWNFIASPIAAGTTPSTENGILSSDEDDYDLFYYDEPAHYWRNYKANGDNTADPGFIISSNGQLSNGQGYLYANAANTTLSFTGTLVPSTTAVEKPLSFNSTAGDLAGWNLVGNPFACNATVSMSGYIISQGAIVATTGTVAAPCSGVMVKADATGQTVTFTPTTNAAVFSTGHNQLNITIANNMTARGESSMIDNAIVSFNENSQLEKFVFFEDIAKLYIPQGEKDYAIVSAEAQGEMPVCFKATKDGEYTITVSPEGVELNYLHLIDNMTGMDVDLLQTPSYTFEASTRDYESRFKLVFAGASTDSATDESFAYYDGSEWQVSNEGEATLQVVDVIGRIVKSETINGNFSLNLNQKAGVYMLRLVNGENVKVQKVVVR